MADQESIEAMVAKYIAEHKVMVFSKSYCPFCKKAKSALSQFTKDFTVLEIENDPNCNEIQDVLGKLTGGRSVPRVFIGGKFIGGGDDTAAAAASGQLQTLLAAAGAS